MTYLWSGSGVQDPPSTAKEIRLMFLQQCTIDELTHHRENSKIIVLLHVLENPTMFNLNQCFLTGGP